MGALRAKKGPTLFTPEIWVHSPYTYSIHKPVQGSPCTAILNLKCRHMTSDSTHKGLSVLQCLRLTSANIAEALRAYVKK